MSVPAGFQQGRFRRRPGADLNFSVGKSDRGRTLTVQFPANPSDRRDVELTDDEIGQRSWDLARLLERVGNAEMKPELADERANRLYEMAIEGAALYRRLIPDEELRALLDGYIRSDVLVEISPDDSSFDLPWELLYLGDPSQEIHEDRFLGYGRLVYRVLRKRLTAADLADEVMATRHVVRLLANRELPAVRDVEQKYFVDLSGSQRIELETLGDLDERRRREGIKTLCEFVKGECHILHLACHSSNPDEERRQKERRTGRPVTREPVLVDDRAHRSFLEASKQFRISLVEFEAHEPKLKGGPLVILNACSTGVLNPRYSTYWATHFLALGARCVLATRLEVPDWFAAKFITRVYDRLLDGQSLGQSVREAQAGTPQCGGGLLSLGYVLYGSPWVTLKQAPAEVGATQSVVDAVQAVVGAAQREPC